MPSNFEFLAGDFPKLAEYGRKAENYLYIDSDVCMFFVSRIFDNVVKYLCSVNNVDTDGTKLAEPINELFQKNAIDEGIYLLLEMMRTFRNGNAHDKDYSRNESMILLQVSHLLCEWLMERYSKSGYQRKGFVMPSHEDMSQGDDADDVNSVLTFGVFAPIVGNTELLCAGGIRSANTEGYNVGDKFTASVIGIDSVRGHVALRVNRVKVKPLIPAKSEPAQQQVISPVPAKTAQQQVISPVPAKTTQQQVNFSVPAKTAKIQTPAPPKPKPPAMSNDEFVNLCATGTAQKVRAAITNGANVNASKAKGRTALIAAVLTNPNPDVIELLIDSGANVNAKSNKGVNALGYAHHNKHLANTKALARLQALTKS